MRNRIDVKLVNNEKDYLKCTSKASYMSQKIFDNNLVAIGKSKVSLKLNKSDIGMSILELSKRAIHKVHMKERGKGGGLRIKAYIASFFC